jgi:hypothetical protein
MVAVLHFLYFVLYSYSTAFVTHLWRFVVRRTCFVAAPHSGLERVLHHQEAFSVADHAYGRTALAMVIRWAAPLSHSLGEQPGLIHVILYFKPIHIGFVSMNVKRMWWWWCLELLVGTLLLSYQSSRLSLSAHYIADDEQFIYRDFSWPSDVSDPFSYWVSNSLEGSML